MKIAFMLLSCTLKNCKEDTLGWGHWGRISTETLQFSCSVLVLDLKGEDDPIRGQKEGFLGKGSKGKGGGGKNRKDVSGMEPSSISWL